jgi:YD repeat-containing protein
VTYTGTEFRIDTATDALGRTTTFSYNASNMLTGVRLPGTSSPNNDIAYVYDASNNIDTVTVSAANWDYNTTTSGSTRTLRIEGPLDNDRVVVSNQSIGLITSDAFTSTNPPFVGATTSYLYDTSGRVQRVTAQEGNYVTYGYDARGNVTLTTTVAKSGSGLSNIVTSATYPVTCANQKTCNKPLTTTDALARVTTYTYNATHGALKRSLRRSPSPAVSGSASLTPTARSRR